MTIGIKTGSLERYYICAYQNALDVGLSEKISGRQNKIASHKTSDSIIQLFSIYQNIDNDLSDMYFSYKKPTPLLYDPNAKDEDEIEDETNAHDNIAFDPDIDGELHPQVEEEIVIHPRKDIIESLKRTVTEDILQGICGNSKLTIDDAIFDEILPTKEASKYFTVISGHTASKQSTPLQDVYPSNKAVVQDVQCIFVNQKSFLNRVFVNTIEKLSVFINENTRQQGIAMREGVARPEYRDRRKTVRIPPENHRYGGHVRTSGGYNLRVKDGIYIGKWNKDPNGATASTSQIDYLKTLLKDTQHRTNEEKIATERVSQYLSKGEAGTLIERLGIEVYGEEIRREKSRRSLDKRFK